MNCIVVTPEKTVLDQETTFVALPLFDGEIGIGKGHTPLVGRLGAGELRVSCTDGKVLYYYVEGGFVEVLDDGVVLMTTHAWPASMLNVDVAEKQLQDALARPGNTLELSQIREKKVNARRARLRLAQKMASEK
ncbi:MAG TPA: F0F1 ATP synthase subunit epsilon [Planctomycetaceae bacterium]|nr:F0F1 ATP synthase subunit epsilon [Planctomycetaceae bacterium]